MPFILPGYTFGAAESITSFKLNKLVRDATLDPGFVFPPGVINIASLSMNADRILGRTTPGLGPAEEISVGTGLLLAAGVLSAVASPLTTADISIPILPGATYTTLNKWLDITQSPGIVTGGNLTDGGGGNVNVAAGTAILRIANDDVSQLVSLNFAGAVVPIANDNVVHYLALSYNGGVPIIIQATSESAFDLDTQIPLGSAVRLGNTLVFNNPFKVGDALTNVIQRFDSLAPLNRDVSIGGLLLGETGVRNVTLTAGVLWARLNNTPVAAKNTGLGSPMATVYYNGTNWVFTPGVTQWPNLQYNNVATGLVNMAVNRYSNLWFYLTVDTATMFCQYGQAQYNNFAQALAESPPTFRPPNAPYVAVLLGRFIFQQGAATATQIQSAFTVDFGGTVVTNHNDLANIQGGGPGEYFHLTNAQYTAATTGSITGTANQVFANGTFGVPQTGPVTLTLPQSIATTSNVQFGEGRFSPRLYLVGGDGPIPTPPTYGARDWFQYSNNHNVNIALTSGAAFLSSVKFNASGDASHFGALQFDANLRIAQITLGNGAAAPPAVFTLTSTGINATAIGATTPSTGAFTNGSFSGTATFTRDYSGGVPAIYFPNDESVIQGPVATTQIRLGSNVVLAAANVGVFLINGAGAGQWTSTGLNSMAIGATTPSTGKFTSVITDNGTISGYGGMIDGGGVAILGTISNHDLVIYQNNATVARFTGTGFNTKAIESLVAAAPAARAITLGVTGAVVGDGAAIYFQHNGERGARIYEYAFSTNQGNLIFSVGNGAAYLDVATMTATGLNATPIGATTPSTGRFTTLNTLNSAVIIGNAGSGVPALVVAPDNAVGINFVVQRAADASGTTAIGTSTPHNLDLLVGNVGRVRIDTAGNVGIGTTGPTAQLHTTGSVRFQAFGAGTLVTDASGNVSVSGGGGGPSAAKAWVRFDWNGTIISAFNVSSVTHVGTGAYQVNFTTAFANANYCALVSSASIDVVTAYFPATGWIQIASNDLVLQTPHDSETMFVAFAL